MEIQDLHKLFLKSKGIATDTRGIQKNQLFFALKGENFNGNTFAWQAIKKGAGYAIIDDPECVQDERYILVKNVLKTLQNLATFHRRYLKIPILAITGSNGKTTSKELIHAVLRKKLNTVATKGNLNNHIGVPLTLLSIKEGTEFGIVEMGANHHGEIKNLCEIAQPDYGYITNFGKAHLEGFGSVEGVVQAKSELYEHLISHNKLIFLNSDDPIQRKKLSYAHTFAFGTSGDVNVRITYPDAKKNAQVIKGDLAFESQLTGNYNAINIAAAICIGTFFQVPEEHIRKAIEAYSPKNNRSQLVKFGNITLLMDAYNANPTSMKAALESFEKFPAVKKALVLGDMFELGSDSEKEHQEITSYLEKTNFSPIFLIGSNFSKTSSKNENINKFENFKDFELGVIMEDLRNSFVLVKGSRGMALERIIDLISEKHKRAKSNY